MYKLLLPLALFLASSIAAQTGLAPLSVEKIMRDPKWIGSSPSGAFWSRDGKKLWFLWNPGKEISDSLYYISLPGKTPVKATAAEKTALQDEGGYVYNHKRTAAVYASKGDIYWTELKSGRIQKITSTTGQESNPLFSFSGNKIVYTRESNLYAWDISSGLTEQLTNNKTGESSAAPSSGSGRAGFTSAVSATAGNNPQEQWLQKDQLAWFQVLRERKEKKEKAEAYTHSLPKEKEMRSFPFEGRNIQGLSISPDGRFIHFRVFRPVSSGKSTIVPSYVTETGFTTDITARSKVGGPQAGSELYIYDRDRDSLYTLKPDSIPGIRDLPDYVKDYPKTAEEKSKKPVNRGISFGNVSWSPTGLYAVLEVRSLDNKDRWLMRFDTAGGRFSLLDRQRDEAWIGGPGIGGFRDVSGWVDEHRFWFRSEKTGYSHLYLTDMRTGESRALTSGNYEVQSAQLSLDKKFFYLSTNEVHPGEQHFYRLRISDGQKEQLTRGTGAHQVSLSPDEKTLAILYSTPTRPWELYLQDNKAGALPEQITFRGRSDEFNSYPWREPELIRFTARDGAGVYARLYKPDKPHPGKPAVLFVHGAGYLQNAHKWWSSYFREFMFNNLLAENGYYVMDIDYRGSAGYGRDWRTGIYRHMGGKDLTDHVDAVQYLVKEFGVDSSRIGIYGGSYGGFISLMALFTEPDVFAAGAALRPVTDWANYNHGYTSNILNEPFTDSIAYRRSSPLYFAEGLKGHLLICHGMVDVNVHYQDAVKLAQRLIELGKDNWELASYPMEDHGFVEPSSWTDEYKRIFKLFERVLKR